MVIETTPCHRQVLQNSTRFAMSHWGVFGNLLQVHSRFESTPLYPIHFSTVLNRYYLELGHSWYWTVYTPHTGQWNTGTCTTYIVKFSITRTLCTLFWLFVPSFPPVLVCKSYSVCFYLTRKHSHTGERRQTVAFPSMVVHCVVRPAGDKGNCAMTTHEEGSIAVGLAITRCVYSVIHVALFWFFFFETWLHMVNFFEKKNDTPGSIYLARPPPHVVTLSVTDSPTHSNSIKLLTDSKSKRKPLAIQQTST